MTAFNLYPTFTDRDGYVGWRTAWKATYAGLSAAIKVAKVTAKEHQRVTLLQGADGFHKATRAQAELRHHRAVGRKMMSLLQEAKDRRDRIIEMMKEIEDQGFPADLGVCRNVDFHYNKGQIQFPFLPMWTLRVKGKSYYVDEVEANVPWTTRARASSSTKGVLRFSKCRIVISKNKVAMISLDESAGVE